MLYSHLDRAVEKGWFFGPWNSTVPIAIGFANQGIADNHYHESTFEVYLVGRGSTTAIVDGNEVRLSAGDILVVEPGETHTFTSSSDDYCHFVVQAPFNPTDKVAVD